MGRYLFGLNEIDKTKIALVGGKGANLGELCAIDNILVPGGFCISIEAFNRVIEGTPTINQLLGQLSVLKAEDREKIIEVSVKIRAAIEETPIAKDIADEVVGYLENFNEDDAFAVRSSATAEDLPTASFAGQQDTYLNIVGKAAILKHISKCWTSLFTERAVTYRLKNGFGHHNVYLGVVIQKMVSPQAAGVMFTAGPVTGNRKVLSIDAGFGLGEAMVSGLVNADVYKVRNSEVIDKKIPVKKLAIYAVHDGGTKEHEVEASMQNTQVLTDEQIIQLERIGRKIEEHFGSPQDIEWCLADGLFYIVQSRPITTLYPVPERDDKENHVYISVGHQQMMTDALKPLGLSLFQLTAFRPMFKAGGRLFVDVTDSLASPTGREILLRNMGQHDPLIKDALTAIIDRGDFIQLAVEKQPAVNNKGVAPAGSTTQPDPDAAVVSGLIKQSQTDIEKLKEKIQAKRGPELIDFIVEDMQRFKKSLLVPENMAVLMAGINASVWINEKMNEWLGEKNAADTLSQSVPNNITAEMGLALLDVADVIRPYPEIIKYLQEVKNDNFLDGLQKFNGGKETQDAINNYLDKYGMRCAGEIDITKARWSEKPAMLIPAILNNIKNFGPGAGKQKFEQGLKEALDKEQALLSRLEQLPDGEQKASDTKRMIGLIRNLIGYREYPKYGIVSHYFIYRLALLREAERLVQRSVIHNREDIYYLTFEELGEAIRNNNLDYAIIENRKEEHKLFEKLTPPRVITSDGEIIAGKYKREHLPADALVGLAVSSGIIEGRARVILNMEDANMQDGDILVTTFTDPSWTPLFVGIKGLVTEVGGLMTHGAVIAREYGLPAVVGVENATSLIKDGQRILVNGTDGYVEIL